MSENNELRESQEFNTNEKPRPNKEGFISLSKLADHNLRRGSLLGYIHDDSDITHIKGVVLEIPESGLISYDIISSRKAFELDRSLIKPKAVVLKDMDVIKAFLRIYFSEGIAESPASHYGDGFVVIGAKTVGGKMVLYPESRYNRADLVDEFNGISESIFNFKFPEGKLSSSEEFIELLSKKPTSSDGDAAPLIYTQMKEQGFKFISRFPVDQLTVFTYAAEKLNIPHKVADPCATRYGVISDGDTEHFDIYLKASKEDLREFWEVVESALALG
jgi:hypothetical protein